MTYIFDLDGTLVKFHTNEWIPGALDMLEQLSNKGDQIIFVTRRPRSRDKNTKWSPTKTEEELLPELSDRGIEYRTILYDVDSPRIIADDTKPKAIHHKQNSGWKESFYQQDM